MKNHWWGSLRPNKPYCLRPFCCIANSQSLNGGLYKPPTVFKIFVVKSRFKYVSLFLLKSRLIFYFLDCSASYQKINNKLGDRGILSLRYFFQHEFTYMYCISPSFNFCLADDWCKSWNICPSYNRNEIAKSVFFTWYIYIVYAVELYTATKYDKKVLSEWLFDVLLSQKTIYGESFE